MVFIKNRNLPALQWNLGRIQEAYPEVDGEVRIATIHTAGGDKNKAVRLLCPLPINNDKKQ